MNHTSNKILFIFDRTVHYHKALFKALEEHYQERLVLLSGNIPDKATGRVGTKEKVIQNEVKYNYKEIKLGNFILRKADFINSVKKIKPQIIVIHGHVGNISYWNLMRLKKTLKFKLIAWQCGYEYNPNLIKDVFLRLFIKGFDYQLAYHTNAKKYAQFYGAKPETITIIHNTINEAEIEVMPKDQAMNFITHKHPEIKGKKIILFVGAVLKEKKIELLINALAVLSRPDVMLIIVGDGPYLPIIKTQCNGRQDVIFTGRIINGIGPYFDVANVYLLPGTGGLGINEAMSHKLPILSGYADGSADDLVLDGVNGFRLSVLTPEEIAQKIELIIDNPALARKMGQTSFEMITGKYSFGNFINRITDVLDTI